MATRNRSRALNLAHLVGPSTRASEDEDEKQKGRASEEEDDDEKDDDKPAGRRARRAEDDDEKEDKPQGRASRRRSAKAFTKARVRASDDEGEEEKPKGRRARRAEDDDDEEGDDRDPKGRRTAAEEEDEGEDDDDGEDEGPKARAARRRERERCQAIICSRHAKGREATAAQFAFGTSMSSREAVALLKTLPGGESAEAGGLSGAMSSYGGHRPAASAPPAPSGRQAITNSWDLAAQKAGIRSK